ncbi:MAG: DUF2877 domain-containing protein [Firmicutes bacterium]|jgi:hypothetical protein|nr:DUF2877 domain-containing protein [Bacillota bacterium]
MNMYEQPFYLAAVSHGPGFEPVLKCQATFRVHSVFAHAINLVAGLDFLTILPLGRGCGKDCATVAVSGDFSFFSLDISPGDEVSMSAFSRLRLGKKTVMDFSGSRGWRSPLSAANCLCSIRDENMATLKSALAEKCNGESVAFGGVLEDIRKTLLENDREGLDEALAGIIGFGPGLTPSGDDLVLGISLVRSVFGRSRRAGRNIWEESVRRNLHKTSDLSAFFIRRALAGFAHETIERALVYVLMGEPGETKDAVDRLLSVGATSGSDIGLGMYLALNWQRRYAWCSKG